MLPKFKWNEVCADADAARGLAETLNLPLPVARVLVSRGVATPAEARRFLNPSLTEHLGDPCDFPGVRIAAERLWKAIQDERDIVVYGDFDADGVAAAAVLVTALRRLGGRAEVFLPVRDPEGYGLTRAALERCLRERAGLPGMLVTVDCGISSPEEVAYLTRLGVEVIITDHHEPNGPLPEAAAIVNPKVGAAPGAEHLCGAGVAFKVAHALVEIGRAKGWYRGASLGGELLVPTGLATVTDIVPLTGENRLLVWNALKYWPRYAGAGLQALLARAAQQTITAPDAYTFGFILGPRINAAGRMESAMTAFELLMTRDRDQRDQAAALAAQLEAFNGRRRGVEERIVLAARKQCGLDAEGATFNGAAVVVGGDGPHAGEEGWHPGVIGIVAARLCDATGRPAAVVSFDQHGAGRGSLRAGEGYHALKALADASEALAGYGGHARAAGFHVRPGAFDLFKRLFCKACSRQAAAAGGCPSRTLTVDGWLEPEDLTLELHREIQRLAPFGNGNPVPRWGLRRLTVKEVRPIGASGQHLLCVFERSGRLLPRGVWFRNGCEVEALRSAQGPLDAVVELRENTSGGESSVELQIVDVGPSARS
ncbi:MAG TPA: DHH family phosphoesterase [Kiritimatiellia bacterium]|nr:DHH family phosphoesterase [Kiritimatiellia bacterium]HRU71287.1 DHH family phosphoesterase [Kiritimatiellia bacterium]